MGWKEQSAGMNAQCLATFGEEAVYTPAAGSPVTIRGIFDEDHVELDMTTGAAVTSSSPVLSIRASDLVAAPKRGDSVLVRGRTFAVVDWRPDSEDGGLVILREAA